MKNREGGNRKITGYSEIDRNAPPADTGLSLRADVINQLQVKLPWLLLPSLLFMNPSCPS